MNRIRRIFLGKLVSAPAYIITEIVVGGKLDGILTATTILQLEFNYEFAMMFIGIFCTTISSRARSRSF